MTGPWTITVPEAGTNLALNPSAEAAGNFGAYAGATVTQDTAYARFGYNSFKIVPGGTNRGMTATLKACANAIHYVTFYAIGVTGTLAAALNGVPTFNNVAVIGGSTGGLVRYGVQIPASEANGSTTLTLRNTANETWWVDAIQVEQASYYTSYIDGDRGSLYRWSGLRNGSASTRDVQDRSGGRERNLLDDYGLKVRQQNGAGLPGIQNNYLSNTLVPGSTFQSAKVEARTMILTFDLHASTGVLTALHSRRKQLINLFKSEATRGNQPFLLGYTAANSGKTLYAKFRYDDGLRLGKIGAGPTFFESNASVPVALIAEDPLWYEDSADTATLDFTDSLTSSQGCAARIGGAWQNLGTGFNSLAYCTVVDKQRGRVYFGGYFTTANGVTVNGICYWDGSTFVAMDSGTNSSFASGRAVNALALAANGDLWVAGNFTTVGSAAAATKGLARWNIATGTWTAFNESTASFTAVYAVAVDLNNVVYIAGQFTDWEGDAGSDNICKTSDNGVNWDSMSTGCNNIVWALAAHPDGKVYVGGQFTTAGGTTVTGICYWSGSAFVAMGPTPGFSSGGKVAYALSVAPNGFLYIGGNFTGAGGLSANGVVGWTGNAFFQLGGTWTGGTVYSILAATDGMIYIGGSFSVVGGLTAPFFALFNGTSWALPDVTFVSEEIRGISEWQTGNIYVARGAPSAQVITCGGRVTLTTTGTTVSYPIMTVVGPSSGSAVLAWLENQSAGFRLYLNLTVFAGEVITIDLTPGVKTITSTWRGLIAQQPLGASNFSTFALLPGANVIEAYMTGTTTAAAILVNNWPTHQSVDMAAA